MNGIWENFISGFLTQLLAGLVVVFLAGVYLNKKFKSFWSPDLSLQSTIREEKGVNKDYVQAKLDEDTGLYKIRFQPSIKNNGRGTISRNGGYWHIYFISEKGTVPFGIEYLSPHSPAQKVDDNHYREVIHAPIFPGSSLDLNVVFHIELEKEQLDKFKIYYFFSTEYGNFPREAVPDEETGLTKYKNMGSLDIKKVN